MGITNPNKQKTEEHRRRLIDLSGVPGEWFLLNLIITELSASNYHECPVKLWTLLNKV